MLLCNGIFHGNIVSRATQPSWKFAEIPRDGGLSQASPGKEIPGAGALKQKCPPLGIWIFFGTTRYIFSFLWDQCALYPVNRSQKNEIEQNNARQTDLNE